MALSGLSGEALPMALLTRRMFLASCAATIAARSAGLQVDLAYPTAASIPASEPLRLYVQHSYGGLLSLGCEFDSDGPPAPWTWRQYIMHGWDKDVYAREFDERSLEHAKECFSDHTGIYLEEGKGDYGEYATLEKALARFEQ